MADVTITTAPAPVADSSTVAAPAAVVKPGYKTTEFWLSFIATLAGVALASGILPATGIAAQIVGGVVALLAQIGYTASRTNVKNAA